MRRTVILPWGSPVLSADQSCCPSPIEKLIGWHPWGELLLHDIPRLHGSVFKSTWDYLSPSIRICTSVALSMNGSWESGTGWCTRTQKSNTTFTWVPQQTWALIYPPLPDTPHRLTMRSPTHRTRCFQLVHTQTQSHTLQTNSEKHTGVLEGSQCMRKEKIHCHRFPIVREAYAAVQRLLYLHPAMFVCMNRFNGMLLK